MKQTNLNKSRVTSFTRAGAREEEKESSKYEGLPQELKELAMREGGVVKGTSVELIIQKLYDKHKKELTCAQKVLEGETEQVCNGRTFTREGYGGKKKDTYQVECKRCNRRRTWGSGGQHSVAMQLWEAAVMTGQTAREILELGWMDSMKGGNTLTPPATPISSAKFGSVSEEKIIIQAQMESTTTELKEKRAIQGDQENKNKKSRQEIQEKVEETGMSLIHQLREHEQVEEMEVDKDKEPSDVHQLEFEDDVMMLEEEEGTIEQDGVNDAELVAVLEPNKADEVRNEGVNRPDRKTMMEFSKDEQELMAKQIELGISEEEARGRVIKMKEILEKRRKQKERPLQAAREQIVPGYISIGKRIRYSHQRIRDLLGAIGVNKRKVFNIEFLPNGVLELLIPRPYLSTLQTAIGSSGRAKELGWKMWRADVNGVKEPEQLKIDYSRPLDKAGDQLDEDYAVMKAKRERALEYSGAEEATRTCIRQRMERLHKEYHCAKAELAWAMIEDEDEDEAGGNPLKENG
jgi:hypothetical protein